MISVVKRCLLGALLTGVALGTSRVAGAQAAGAAVFASSGCAHCHGATGEGGDLGPSLREVHRKLKPAEIRKQILVGGGAMPAFGQVLTSEQVQALVAFLRAKTWIATPPASAPVAP